MGVLRRCLFRFIYPLPRKGEDALAYKQTLIDEYIQFSQFQTLLKIYWLKYLVPSAEKRKTYLKNVKDREEKSRLEACKLYRKMRSHTR